MNEKTAAELVHKHNLATHLGLTGQDAVFSAPRNFRSRGLDDSANSEAIEPLSEI